MSSMIGILGKYIVETKFKDFPEEVVDKAKLIILDALGCGFAGSRTEPARVVIELVKDLGGKPESTIIGERSRVNCALAGFANSYSVDALDYDDSLFKRAFGHTAACVIPAALAVGERVGASGKDMISAVILGYEVGGRIGYAACPSAKSIYQCKHGSAWQTFGTAAAACKLLELDESEIANAFGYAISSGPLPSFEPPDRPKAWNKMRIPEQCKAGILGALLAKKGFISLHTILDSDLGFFRMVGSDRYDRSLMTQGLGKNYPMIMNDAFKPYSACLMTHTTIEATQRIIQAHKIKPEDIRSIDVKTLSSLHNHQAVYRPPKITDAEFSIPYVVAMVVLGEKTGLNWYVGEKFKDPEVHAVMDKVRIEPDPEADRLREANESNMVSTVTVHTKDRPYTERVEYLKGSPERPLSRDEVVNKFLDLVSSATAKEGLADQILATINRLESVSDISELASLLASEDA